MKKYVNLFVVALICMVIISACSGNKDNEPNPGDANQGQIEQPGDTNNPDEGVEPDGTEEPDQSEEPSDSEGTDNEGEEVGSELDQIVEQLKGTAEQRPTMKLEADMLEDWYHLDAELLDDYSINVPMMNISTNEISILKVKDGKDIATVEEALKQRAEDVQKQFEQYLQDQYENAKNYKLVTKGQYILFVIDNKETAERMVNEFEDYFDGK